MVTPTSKNGKQETLKPEERGAFLLYDFDIEGTTLKFEHMAVLKKVATILDNGGSIDIVGMSSRSGPEALNTTLSMSRARSVLAFLKGIVKKKGIKVGLFQGRGTAVAAQQQQPPASENERYRSVYIAVSKSPDPPPAPKPQEIQLPDGKKLVDSVQPDLSPLGNSLTDTFSLVADGLSAAAGFAEPFVALVSLTFAEILGVGGGVISVITAMISSPLAWQAQDRVAKLNGYIKGVSDAYAEMAAAYKDNALNSKPVDQWPAIPTPKTPGSSDPDSAMQRADMNGRMEGSNAAWAAVMALEKNPTDLKTKDGKTIKVSGKLFLRALYVSSGGNVRDAVIQAINVQLKAAGHREYPTY